MKIIYILLAGLCLLSCEKKKIEDVIREVEPEQPSSIHYYYSYKAGEVINAENSDMLPVNSCPAVHIYTVILSS